MATLTLVGPASVWFGIGFNASQMADRPYAIIVDGDGKGWPRILSKFMRTGTVASQDLCLV